MDNLETLATLVTQDTNYTMQKTKKKSNKDRTKNRG